jgi:signal transduction histidine kinase
VAIRSPLSQQVRLPSAAALLASAGSVVGLTLAGAVVLRPPDGGVGRLTGYTVATLCAAVLGGGWVRRTARRRRVARRVLAMELAHEFRTPLAKIRMFTEMMLAGRERSDAERREWLETLDRESHRLGEVMENLLLLLRSEESDPFPVRRSEDFGALIEDVCAGQPSHARTSRGITIDPPEGVMVEVDTTAMRQALGNLLTEVLHRADESGVRVTLERSGGAAILSLAPLAAGSTASSRTAPVHQGIGFELARRIIEAHGGRVREAEGEFEPRSLRVTLPLAGSDGNGTPAERGRAS